MVEEILVVAVNNFVDLEILINERFYEIPVDSRYPSREALYLAIYVTKDIALDGIGGIEYIAKIYNFEKVRAGELIKIFKRYNKDTTWYEENSDKILYKINVGPLIRLPNKIINPRGVRVTYKYTTFDKLLTAREYDEL